MKRVARWLWRCIPQERRYRYYRTLVNSNHFVIRLMWGIVDVWRHLTLWYHRRHARQLWPEARGLTHAGLALWGAFLRYHDSALSFVWRNAHHLRKWRTVSHAGVDPTKVMHVTGSFDLGGTQTQIKFLCTYASTRFKHEPIEIFPELNYLFRRGLAVNPIDYMGRSVLSRTAGHLVANVNYRSSQLIQIYKLVCDFRREHPYVVVGWGHEMCVTTFVAAAIARVPHIVFCIRTVNPTYGWVPQWLADMLRPAHRRMLPFVSKVVVNSTLLQTDHAQWVGMSRDAIAACANGIDIKVPTPADAELTRARVRAELGISDETTVIVNVARFSTEKGQASLVEANRLLIARGADRPFVWLLCGDGPTLAEVKARADALGMPNMRFLGRIGAVKDILCASDIFVMPSKFEGMPNAMLEAMAAGLPCISTTRSGALDIARDGREALYYDERDVISLATHVARFLDDPAAGRALGALAAERVKAFPVRRFVEAFERVLDEVTAVPEGEPQGVRDSVMVR